MQLGAEIVEGKRSVLEYLLPPVRRVTDDAGRGRGVRGTGRDRSAR